jgi:hypothetical protein
LRLPRWLGPVALVGVSVGLVWSPSSASAMDSGGDCSVNWAVSGSSILYAFSCDEPAGFVPAYAQGAGFQFAYQVRSTGGSVATYGATSPSVSVRQETGPYSDNGSTPLPDPGDVLVGFTLTDPATFAEVVTFVEGDGTTIPPDPASASTTTTSAPPATTTTTVPATTTSTSSTTTTGSTSTTVPATTTTTAASAGPSDSSTSPLPYDSRLVLGVFGCLAAGALFGRLVFGSR